MSRTPSRTLLVIPTYEERENVAPLVRDIKALGLECDMLFVDDNSPDGTGRLLDEMAQRDPRLRILHRPGKLGVGSAHLAGIRFAYREGYERLVTMDCDFTHNPAYLLDLLAASEGADVVVGSRYLQRRSLTGWNPLRKLLTYTGHFLTRTLLDLPYDATGALRLYDLRTIPAYVFDVVSSAGYSFFFESLYILHLNGLRVREVPIILPPRTYGHSKMSVREVLKSVWLLVATRLNATFNRELLVAVPPLSAERLDPLLKEDQGWAEYWRSDSASGRVLYNVIAAFYRKAIIRPALSRFVRRHFPPGARVLHAGCGSGQVDAFARRHVQVTAMDISPAALDAYRRVNGANAEVLHGSLFDIPWPSESADGVYNLGVMEHFTEEEIRRILGEFRRILRPEGRLVAFWPLEFGLSVLFFKALKVALAALLRRDVKFHPDEITRLRSRAHAYRLFTSGGFEVLEYSFGPRDAFTYAVVVARRARA